MLAVKSEIPPAGNRADTINIYETFPMFFFRSGVSDTAPRATDMNVTEILIDQSLEHSEYKDRM